MWVQRREVTQHCRQQLALSRVERPAPAHCQLSLSPVLIEDHKTVGEADVSPFQVAEGGCRHMGLCTVSPQGLCMVGVSRSCLSCKAARKRHKRYSVSSVSIQCLMQQVPGCVLHAEFTDSHFDYVAVWRVLPWLRGNYVPKSPLSVWVQIIVGQKEDV